MYTTLSLSLSKQKKKGKIEAMVTNTKSFQKRSNYKWSDSFPNICYLSGFSKAKLVRN